MHADVSGFGGGVSGRDGTVEQFARTGSEQSIRHREFAADAN
jgi:hypothetical protein